MRLNGRWSGAGSCASLADIVEEIDVDGW
jgi:hypothetical protein